MPPRRRRTPRFITALLWTAWLSLSPSAPLQALPEDFPFHKKSCKPAATFFPRNAGLVDITKPPYNADRTGKKDCSDIIQQAINDQAGGGGIAKPGSHRILFFPNGSYLISRPLHIQGPKDSLQTSYPRMLTLMGESRKGVIFWLRNHSPQFQNPAKPAALFSTHPWNPTPSGGGTSAYSVNFLNLTLDTGILNPGAVGINLLANGQSTLSNLTIRTGSKGLAPGRCAILLNRSDTGPLLIENLHIQGFDVGILAGNSNRNAVIRDVFLESQTICGIQNGTSVSTPGMMLTLEQILSDNSVPAIRNLHPTGSIQLINANLLGGSPQIHAIENKGQLYLRNVRSSGYQSLLLDGKHPYTPASATEFDTAGIRLSTVAPLESKDAPYYYEKDASKWINVRDFGANPLDNESDSDAIQAAIDSTAPGEANEHCRVLYFPSSYDPQEPARHKSAAYILTDTIVLRHGIQKVEGLFSTLYALSPHEKAAGTLPDAYRPMLRIQRANSAPIWIENLFLLSRHNGWSGIELECTAPCTLRRVVARSITNAPGCGPLFLEDVSIRRLHLSYPQQLFATQLHLRETLTPKIVNNGGLFHIFGLYANNQSPLLRQYSSGFTEITGLCRSDRLMTGLSINGDALPSLPLPSSGISLSTPDPWATNRANPAGLILSRHDPSSSLEIPLQAQSPVLKADEHYRSLPRNVNLPSGQDSREVSIRTVSTQSLKEPSALRIRVPPAPDRPFSVKAPCEAFVTLSAPSEKDHQIPSTSLILHLSAQHRVALDGENRIARWGNLASSPLEATLPEFNDFARPALHANVFADKAGIDLSSGFLLIPAHDSLNGKPGTSIPQRTWLFVFKTGGDVNTHQILFFEGGGIRQTGFMAYIAEKRLHVTAWNALTEFKSAAWGPYYVSIPISPDTPYLLSCGFSESGGKLLAWLNGNSFGQTTPPHPSVSGLAAHPFGIAAIGARYRYSPFEDWLYLDKELRHLNKRPGGFPFSGFIGEILIYDMLLPREVLGGVENHLMQQYHIDPSAPAGSTPTASPEEGSP